jgi:hypothetical protein
MVTVTLAHSLGKFEARECYTSMLRMSRQLLARTWLKIGRNEKLIYGALGIGYVHISVPTTTIY